MNGVIISISEGGTIGKLHVYMLQNLQSLLYIYLDAPPHDNGCVVDSSIDMVHVEYYYLP